MTRHLYAPSGDSRENAVPCGICKRSTWNLCALCDAHCAHTDALTEPPVGWKPGSCTCTITQPGTRREMRVLNRACPVHTTPPPPDPAASRSDIPAPRWAPPAQANPTPGTEAAFAVAKLRRKVDEQLAGGCMAGGVIGLLDQTVMAQIGVAALRISSDEDLGGVVRALIAAADEITCDMLADAQARL